MDLVARLHQTAAVERPYDWSLNVCVDKNQILFIDDFGSSSADESSALLKHLQSKTKHIHVYEAIYNNLKVSLRCRYFTAYVIPSFRDYIRNRILVLDPQRYLLSKQHETVRFEKQEMLYFEFLLDT